MAKGISDFLLGGYSGGIGGAGALGGLGAAGLVAKGGMAANPWAWGLLGGSVALGGISSLLSEDSPEEKLAKEQLKQLKQLNRRRAGTAKSLGSMFTGANLSTPDPSERLA